ncbi:MAG TPA: Mini-ribonuclease 3 [Clostridiales bacterium]|nr:Mini-ribonuclease 3 [Clostridiales bacterium]
MNEILKYIEKKHGIKFTQQQIDMLNPLVLAYIGDTIYDLFVRTYIIAMEEGTVHRLNNMAIQYVNAASQCSALHSIENELTEEEKNIVRRGRNVKSGTSPKHADIGEYRWATGLEALLGYLYLTGQKERLFHIMELILNEDRGNRDGGD